jgi:F-box-like
MDQVSTLQILPQEVLAYILGLVSPIDIINLGRTCKRLQLCCTDSHVWKRICYARETVAEKGDRYIDSELSLCDMERLVSLKPRKTTFIDYLPESSYGKLDFRAEYLARHGAIKMDWLPCRRNCCKACESSNKEKYQSASLWYNDNGVAEKAIALTEDRTLKVWSLKRDELGNLQNSHHIGSLLLKASSISNGATVHEGSVVVGNTLFLVRKGSIFEIDLQCLKIVRVHLRSPVLQITTMCALDQPGTLAIGKPGGIFIFDSRVDDCALQAPKFPMKLGNSARTMVFDHGFSSTSHSSSIWVGGDSCELMSLDPRNMSTRHSNILLPGRATSLSLLRHPFIPYSSASSGTRSTYHPGIASHALLATVAGSRNSRTTSVRTFLASVPVLPPSNDKLISQLTEGPLPQDMSMIVPATCVTHTGASIATADNQGRIRWFARDGRFIRQMSLDVGFAVAQSGISMQNTLAFSNMHYLRNNRTGTVRSWADFPQHGRESRTATVTSSNVGAVRRMLPIVKDGGDGFCNNDLLVMTKTHLGVVRFAPGEENLDVKSKAR